MQHQQGLKILILRFSAIGDIVLTSPVVRCLKQQLPGLKLHYATKPQFRDLLVANPHIDHIHILKGPLSDTIEELRKENFDYIIDLHHNLRTLLIKRRLGVKSHSFFKQNVAKWLMVNFKMNRLQDCHIVDRYMDTVASLGVRNDGKGLDFYIPPADEVSLGDLPQSHRNGYIAIVIGAKFATKKYPTEKVAEVCQLLQKPVVLLGGPEDVMEGEKIALAGGSLVYNSCGKYSLNQSASLVRQADKVISNDTGLMHIAAAFKKPIVSLWGNTIPEFGMYPYYGDNEVPGSERLEIKGLPCRPCSKIGFERCPKKHFKCMMEIEPATIAKAVST